MLKIDFSIFPSKLVISEIYAFIYTLLEQMEKNVPLVKTIPAANINISSERGKNQTLKHKLKSPASWVTNFLQNYY